MKREADDQSKAIERKVVDLSRRCFTGRVAKMVGLGIFSHFSLLGSNLWAQGAQSGDACPGGGDDDDVCEFLDPDKCPGEMPPIDWCPTSGMKPEDECDTGIKAADQCEVMTVGSDQCESGYEPNDECYNGSTGIQLDVCPSGRSPEPDECYAIPPTFSLGDYCPGGDAVDGIDICEPDGEGAVFGDQCSPEKPGEVSDECRQDGVNKDSCVDTTPDVCPNGTNTTKGDGFDDACGNNLISTGSDQCPDGSDSQDLCGITWTGTHEIDVCPGGASNIDKCAPDDPAVQSDDYCIGGQSSTDECLPAVGDEDECPGGHPNEDNCPSGDPPEDECTSAGGCAGGDQATGYDKIDECSIPVVDGCTLFFPDGVE